MAFPSFLVPVADSWAAFYGDHRMVSVTVRFLHLAAIVVGGGSALAADRRTLRRSARASCATRRSRSSAPPTAWSCPRSDSSSSRAC